MRSLRLQLAVFWALLLAVCLLLGVVVLGLYRLSPAMQLELGRARVEGSCNQLAQRYAQSAPDTATLRLDLARVLLQLVLTEAPYVEGGIWRAEGGIGAYAYPTYEGSSVKTDVPAAERRPEIEFQFALQPTRVDALLRLLHAHGVVRERAGFGLRARLEGLMTGLVDLTYRHAGRWYVLDYKSNRLPAYDPTALEAAMAHSEYDLQALIYTLALHRWLRFRLGDDYDYARDFGGIRYLFCRGLDASRHDSPGIHARRFAPELVHALDALFGHVAGVAA